MSDTLLPEGTSSAMLAILYGGHSSTTPARYRFRYVDQHGTVCAGTATGTPATLAEAAYAAGAWGVSIIEEG